MVDMPVERINGRPLEFKHRRRLSFGLRWPESVKRTWKWKYAAKPSRYSAVGPSFPASRMPTTGLLKFSTANSSGFFIFRDPLLRIRCLLPIHTVSWRLVLLNNLRIKPIRYPFQMVNGADNNPVADIWRNIWQSRKHLWK